MRNVVTHFEHLARNAHRWPSMAIGGSWNYEKRDSPQVALQYLPHSKFPYNLPMEDPNVTPTPRENWILPILAAMLVAALYVAGSWSNQFVYDDHEVIENQPAIHGLGDVVRIFTQPHYLNYPYYRPITRATLLLQKTIWGDRPGPYHFFNAVIAGGVMLAAYALLRWPAMRLPRPVALIGALWFAEHPAMSECVYPAASGRETLMPTLMILLAMWAFVHAGRGWYALAMIFFAAGLLCKELAAVVPGIFFLADITGVSSFVGFSNANNIFRFNRASDLYASDKDSKSPAASSSAGESRKFSQWVRRYVPVAAILLAYLGIRHLVLRAPSIVFDIQHDPLAPFSSFLYGLQTAITPFMELRYEPPKFVWWDNWLCVAALVFLAGIIFAWFRAPRPIRAVCIFWLGWFILLQLPTAHIIRQEAPYSERYAAPAILAIAAIVAALAANGLRKTSARQAAMIMGVVWIAILAAISFYRGFYYTDDTAFDIHWANTNPMAVNAYIGLGTMAERERDNFKAIQEFQLALQADAQSVEARSHLANAQAATNDFRDAQQNYEWVLRAQPEETVAMVNYAQTLGALAYQTGNPQLSDRAKALLQRAIQLKPDYAQAHFGLAIWNQTFGDPKTALEEMEIAHQLQPDRADIAEKLAKMKSAASSPATSRAATQP